MEDDDTARTDVRFQIRCLELVNEVSGNEQLLATSEYSREGNEAIIIDFDSARNEFDQQLPLDIESHLVCISAACQPRDRGCFAAFAKDRDGNGSFGVWRIPKDGDDRRLQNLAEIPHYSGQAATSDKGAVVWEPTPSDSIEEGTRTFEETAGPGDGTCKSLLTASGRYKSVKFWRFAGGQVKPLTAIDLGGHCEQEWTMTDGIVASWSPLQHNMTAVAVRNQICCCDPRSGQVHSTIKTAVSSGSVRAMDFNPNRESVLASSGDDGILRLWDLRQSQKPVSLVAIGKGEGPTAGPNETHAHEVTCLKFHPFYDQLLATASSDGTARVWMIPEAAFEEHLAVDTVTAVSSVWGSMLPDDLQRSATIVSHDDSIVALRWAKTDTWTILLATVDGAVISAQTPRALRLKALS